jgi:competence protein ComEA
MTRINYWLRRYFGFSQGEVYGFLGIIFFLVLLVCYPLLYRSNSVSYDPSLDRLLLDNLVAQMESEPARYPEAFKPAVSFRLRTFNPNQVEIADWQQMGVPRRVAQRIINYRQKAGDYRFKSDLKKIYGLSDSLYHRLYPYIDLPADKPARRQGGVFQSNYRVVERQDKEKGYSFKSALVPFDLNQADTVQLKQIRGIGSKLSARILLFRQKLGGFYDKRQVVEVYGLAPEVADSLCKYGFVRPGYNPKQIPLNLASSEQLQAHPYIRPQIAHALIMYREQHGDYQQVADIKKIKLIDQELFTKLQPYLTLQ